MDFGEYQERAQPALTPTMDYYPSFWTNGLGGEAGEVVEAMFEALWLHRAASSCQNIAKKIERDQLDGKSADDADEKLLKEAGDVLFYLRQILERRGLSLNRAAYLSLMKLNEMRVAAGREPT